LTYIHAYVIILRMNKTKAYQEFYCPLIGESHLDNSSEGTGNAMNDAELLNISKSGLISTLNRDKVSTDQFTDEQHEILNEYINTRGMPYKKAVEAVARRSY
jgi:hypothetical protein